MRDRLINVLIVTAILAFGAIAFWDINRRIEKECKRACSEMRDYNEKRRCQ